MQYIDLRNRLDFNTVCYPRGVPTAIDLETTGLNQRVDKILCASVCDQDTVAYLLTGEQLRAYLYAYMVQECASPLIFHNQAFDLKMLAKAGIDIDALNTRDTMLMHHLVDENIEHGLDSIIKTKYADNYKEVFWAKYKSFAEASSADALEYACKDGIYTLRIYHDLNKTLHDKQGLVDHVHRLSRALIATEFNGVKVDMPYLKELGVALQLAIKELQISLRESVEQHCRLWELAAWEEELNKRKTPKGKANVACPEFSFDSPKQLGELLYERLGIKEQYNPKTRKRSVDDAALVAIQDKHDVIPLLRQYRDKQKLFGTYIEGILERQVSGVIYPGFNVNGTVTGRISHHSPNLANIPKDNEVRGIFVPNEGCAFVGADYSQLEVVVAANLSGDKALRRIILDGISQHDITAQGVGISRDKAKIMNFAMQYGAGVHKVSKILGCSVSDAELALNKYWETYSGMKTLIDICHKKVIDGEPIISPFGRYRRFPTTYASKWDLMRAQRQAFSSLIQGTGGDITNRAFYLMRERLMANKHGRTMWSVHDEILLEVLDTYAAEEKASLVHTMCGITEYLEWELPLTAKGYGPLARWQKT